jgi:hypothetical protein
MRFTKVSIEGSSQMSLYVWVLSQDLKYPVLQCLYAFLLAKVEIIYVVEVSFLMLSHRDEQRLGYHLDTLGWMYNHYIQL